MTDERYLITENRCARCGEYVQRTETRPDVFCAACDDVLAPDVQRRRGAPGFARSAVPVTGVDAYGMTTEALLDSVDMICGEINCRLTDGSGEYRSPIPNDAATLTAAMHAALSRPPLVRSWRHRRIPLRQWTVAARDFDAAARALIHGVALRNSERGDYAGTDIRRALRCLAPDDLETLCASVCAEALQRRKDLVAGRAGGDLSAEITLGILRNGRADLPAATSALADVAALRTGRRLERELVREFHSETGQLTVRFGTDLLRLAAAGARDCVAGLIADDEPPHGGAR